MADSKKLESFAKYSSLMKPLVSKFIAGNNIEEAIVPCEKLTEDGIQIALDFLGENTKSEEESENAVKSYINVLDNINSTKYPDRMNIAIKLTQCGLDLGDELAEKLYRKVLKHAKKSDTFVRIDMEGSAYTQRTINILEKVLKEYPNTGTVLQSYLYRTPDDAVKLTKLGSRIRIVKGAYLEPKEVAYSEKKDVDKSYIEISKYLMKNGNYPAIATHDESILYELLQFAKLEGIPKSAFELQMLYGIRKDLQYKYLHEGYNVRAYVPYGDSWYPYFTRRLAERPANLLFIMNNMFR